MALDAERILTDYLLADDAVSAITTEILGQTPPKLQQPWARVSLLDDPSTHGAAVDWLIRAEIQIDVFAGTGGTQDDAADLSLVIRDAIAAMESADVEGAVVTAATSRRRRMPDDSAFKPPMPRYMVTATVWMHP